MNIINRFTAWVKQCKAQRNCKHEYDCYGWERVHCHKCNKIKKDPRLCFELNMQYLNSVFDDGCIDVKEHVKEHVDM